MTLVRVGTRGSALARWQASRVATLLRERFPGLETEIEVITTTGDRVRDRSLARVGGKGLFLKELEEALLDGRVDVAVHSLKDVPGELVDGCAVGAVLGRVEPRDALCLPTDKTVDAAGEGSGTAGLDPVAEGAGVAGKAAPAEPGIESPLSALPEGARVGTGSLRRRTQLLARRPDLEVVPIRGNVDTRLRKLDEDGLDAVVLALAGLQRLGMTGRPHHVFDPEEMIPAPGQGALCVEIRDGDEEIGRRVAALEDADVRLAADAERSFLVTAGGSCKVPLAAHAVVDDAGVELRGLLGDAEGNVVQGRLRGERGEARHVGATLARRLLGQGGAELLARVVGWEEPTPR